MDSVAESDSDLPHTPHEITKLYKNQRLDFVSGNSATQLHVSPQFRLHSNPYNANRCQGTPSQLDQQPAWKTQEEIPVQTAFHHQCTEELEYSITEVDLPPKQNDSISDVDLLVADCESYMNWSGNTTSPWNQKALEEKIEYIDRHHIFPVDSFEYDSLSKYFALEHISQLGALCYYYIQLNAFEKADSILEKTRQFVTPTIQNGYLPPEFIEAFDYVWLFLRLYATTREWEVTECSLWFPEIDLTQNTPKSFKDLRPSVKSGVYGLKYYYYKLQQGPLEEQVEILESAIQSNRFYFEWHVCLQQIYRQKRRGIPFTSAYYRSFCWEEEMSGLSLADKLCPNHPRCILARLKLLADVTGFLSLKDHKGKIIKFRDVKLNSPVAVKAYIQKETAKLLELCPKSLGVLLSLADLVSTEFPSEYQDHFREKEYLEMALGYHPNSVKVNHRLGVYYLTLEYNYPHAEEYFKQAYSLDKKYFPALLSLIQILLRDKANAEEALEIIVDSLAESHWSQRQLGTLHFYKGLVHCSESGSKATLMVQEFIKAFQCHEKSLAFQELPKLHLRNGWPSWEVDTKLSYEKIKKKLRRVIMAGMEPEEKSIANKILHIIEANSKSDGGKESQRNQCKGFTMNKK